MTFGSSSICFQQHQNLRQSTHCVVAASTEVLSNTDEIKEAVVDAIKIEPTFFDQ